MSEATPTPAVSRRRRWFQFSLRGLMLLTAVSSAWLIYHARQHAIEQSFLTQALAIDPKAEVAWRAPEWWFKCFGEQPAGVLERIVALDLHGHDLDAQQVAALPIDQLAEINSLTIFGTLNSDEDEEDLKAHWNKTLEIAFYPSTFDSRPSSGLIEGYLSNPNQETERNARESVQNYAQIMKRSMTEPNVLSYGCIRFADIDESTIAKLLDVQDVAMRVAAAKALWKIHSREYAERVVNLATDPKLTTKEIQSLRQRVERDLQKDNILAEIEQGDPDWGAWLASLRPHPELTKAMAQAVTKGRATLSTVYALGKSGDPQAVPALVAALSDQNLCGNEVVDRALVPFGSAELEKTLLAGLENCNAYYACTAASVLGQIGSEQSVARLEKLSTDPQFANAPINVHNVAGQAAQRLKSRSKDVLDDPSPPVVEGQ